MVPADPTGYQTMDSLPTWAWWIIATGVLLSPVIAFLMALLVEIFVGVVKEFGIPGFLVAAGGIGRFLYRKLWEPRRCSDLVGDQA
jgi:hypothetical protein